MRELIGIPFEKLDCFSLVREAYKVQKGIYIPEAKSHFLQSNRVFNEFIVEISKNWIEVPRQKSVCVALKYDIQHPKIVTHFGYMYDFEHILHTTLETGSIIEPYKNLEKMVYGFYDYKGSLCKR